MTQIARACNVSVKTVSRVLNHPEQVSPKTKEAVKNAMEQCGFQINLLAKGLKQNKTNIIVIFLDKHNGDYMNAWRNQMLRCLFRYSSMSALKVVVSPSDSQGFLEDETDGFYLISSGIADGAILFEYMEEDRRVSYLKKTGTPFVVLGQPKDKDIPAVSLDNYDAGFQGGKYLKQKGYQNICYFTNDREFYSTQLRVDGFLKANPEGTVIYGIKNAKDAYQALTKLLNQGTDSVLPDCVFTNGDDRFLGIYRAVAEAGLGVPEDVAVLSADNLPINEEAYPSVSSLCQDLDQIAKECIGLMKALLNQQPYERGSQIFLPSAVVERQSTNKTIVLEEKDEEISGNSTENSRI